MFVSITRIRCLFKLIFLFDLFAVKDLITVHNDPYEAAKDAHAIVVLTEWDEFVVSTVVIMCKQTIFI